MARSKSSELRSRWWSRPLGHLLWFLISGICLTLRKSFISEEPETSPGEEPVIVALWHNRTFTPCYFYKYIVKGKVTMSMLTSASKDGALLATIAEDYGMRAVRGSSGRRGVAGFMDMMSELEQGCSMCITPDGPKGPLYRCHPGVIRLASKSGLPIIPLCISIPHCWRVGGAWDKFVIPVPFSKVILRWGSPLRVPASLRPEEQADYCRRLESALAYGAPDFPAL